MELIRPTQVEGFLAVRAAKAEVQRKKRSVCPEGKLQTVTSRLNKCV